VIVFVQAYTVSNKVVSIICELNDIDNALPYLYIMHVTLITVAVNDRVVVVSCPRSCSVITGSRRRRVYYVTLLSDRIASRPVNSEAYCRRGASRLARSNRRGTIRGASKNVGVRNGSRP